MASHILWQNEEKTITLLDVPQSIVNAQGFNSPADHHLLSSQPRETPYPSTEPKTAKAKAKVVHNTVDEELHSTYRDLLTNALQEVKKYHEGSWCLPRRYVEEDAPGTKKRKLDLPEPAGRPSAVDSRERSDLRQLPGHYLSGLARRRLQQRSEMGLTVLEKESAEGQQHATGARPDAHFFSNDSDHGITISAPAIDEAALEMPKFRIPPGSAFYLGDCSASYDFRQAFRKDAREQGTTPSFDFILLDPPWPNRSIKRTHKTAGATYQTVPTLVELGEMILDMQLESLLAHDALVGVWITNKQAVRDLVLGEGGFFECWGLELVEEWLWLKTTTSGETTSALDATWKKPYEVLLLGRRSEASGDDHQLDIKRSVIIGVPDLHSRKPCLKSLIEPLMPRPQNYKALEIFARHLISGWSSWGDECIKFNYEGYWSVSQGSD